MKYPLTILTAILLCSSAFSQVVDPYAASDSGFLNGADDAQIYYRVLGQGKDTVVVLHGGPGAGMHSIMPSVKPLAEDYVLIFYDQRGGGRSALPADTTKLKPEYFVEDLEAVRSYFGLDKMKVITHSFGSVLLAQYAKKYPEHLDRVILHGATGPDLQQELALRREKASQAPPSPDSVLTTQANALLMELLQGKASDPVSTCREYEDLNQKISKAAGDTSNYRGTTCIASPESVRYYYRYTAQLAPRYYNGWDYTASLKDVKAPVLVIYGKEDPHMIQAQRAWVASYPNSRLLLVPDADKAAFSDQPGFVFPAIDTFLRGFWPEASVE